MKNEIHNTIQGDGFNEIIVDITRNNEIGFDCTDGCLDGCYVVLNIERAKELINTINIFINELEEIKNEEN